MQGNPAFCFKGHLYGGGCPLRLQGGKRYSLRQSVLRRYSALISIDTVIAFTAAVIAAVGLGLQIASYINTKVDRSTSDKQ